MQKEITIFLSVLGGVILGVGIAYFGIYNLSSNQEKITLPFSDEIKKSLDSSKKAQNKIQICPQEWIVNSMPQVIDDTGSKETKLNAGIEKEYFILDGKRREISEFDTKWVLENCAIEPTYVY